MKLLTTASLAILTYMSCLGQEFTMVSDSISHFEIGVPVGWRYGVPANSSLVFMALSQKQNENHTPRENFNINILHRSEIDLDITFSEFLESVGKTEGFKIIEQGEQIINDRKYKYLIETHKNKISKEDMKNHVLFTNNNGNILILTMVTTAENFETFKDLFKAIGLTLKY